MEAIFQSPDEFRNIIVELNKVMDKMNIIFNVNGLFIKAWNSSYNVVADIHYEKESFTKCPNMAIDFAVMEKTKLGTVIPLNAGWSDIGSWSALWETTDRDLNGNVLRGRVIADNSHNCYLRSEHRLVVGLGVENLLVIETDDAVLIADKNEAQNVKRIVKLLEAKGSP